MATLSARERAALPDSAFAYIDSAGRRSLPINDEAHVRNALARFSRMTFEDEDARDRTRMRLLRAAQRYGIAPLGFVRAQLHPELTLPRGQLTFALSDIERSTGHLERLGDAYGQVLDAVRRTIRSAVRHAGGHEVDSHGDEFFAVFERPSAALAASIDVQRRLGRETWPMDVPVRVRIGLHTGRATLSSTGYIGLAVHTVARVSTSAHGGQIVLTGATQEALGEPPTGVSLRPLGGWSLSGLRGQTELLDVRADGLVEAFPPPRAVALAGRSRRR